MKVDESFARDILRLFIWMPVRWFISVIPKNWGFYFFKLMGDLHFYVGGKKNLIAGNCRKLINLDLQSSLKAARGNLENHYRDRLHIFLYPRLKSEDEINRFVKFENIEVLENELKSGRGALLVQPHFGPVQMTLLALAVKKYEPLQIGLPSDEGLSWIGKHVAYKYRLKYEGMIPAPIIAADKYLGKVFKYLKKGGVVLTTGDGAGGGVYLGEHIELGFLNVKRMFPTGPASLSLKTGAVYIPTFIISESCNRFRVVFERPITPKYGNITKDKIYMTHQFRTIAEKYIKEYPQSWHFWDELGVNGSA